MHAPPPTCQSVHGIHPWSWFPVDGTCFPVRPVFSTSVSLGRTFPLFLHFCVLLSDSDKGAAAAGSERPRGNWINFPLHCTRSTEEEVQFRFTPAGPTAHNDTIQRIHPSVRPSGQLIWQHRLTYKETDRWNICHYQTSLQSGPTVFNTGNFSSALLDRYLSIFTMKSIKNHSEHFNFRCKYGWTTLYMWAV